MTLIYLVGYIKSEWEQLLFISQPLQYTLHKILFLLGQNCLKVRFSLNTVIFAAQETTSLHSQIETNNSTPVISPERSCLLVGQPGFSLYNHGQLS